MTRKISEISAALPIIRIKPPTWSKIYDRTEGQMATGFTFDNIFIYNFYVSNERNRYSFKNPDFFMDNIITNEKSLRVYRDFTGHVLNNDLLKKTRENIPSFINLKWAPPQGFDGATNTLEQSDVDVFKYMTGLSPRIPIGANMSTDVFPISKESFELQQMDYTRMTNEYLDMFSWSDGEIKNQYFAEELDGTRDLERFNFIQDRVFEPSAKHKNAVYHSTNADGGSGAPDSPRLNLTEDLKLELTGDSISDDSGNSIVDVTDSSLLENLNIPKAETMPSDILISHNSDFSWNISLASNSCSGLLLGMQSRIRNSRFFLEYQNKFGESDSNSSSRIRPLSQVIANTFPFAIQNIDNIDLTEEPRFNLVGFVIEKTQIIEESEYADNLASREVKFPFIFVPCEVDSPIPNNYLDAAINYDKEYEYHIRAVFIMTVDVTVLNEQTNQRSSHRLKYFVNSTFSQKLAVETRETSPPSFPRDVWAFHEYYTDEEGALALHWAFPVDRQRDTTYFAIFRRCSIYEPFQLLQIYDFNFSIRDATRSAREIKLSGLGRDLAYNQDGSLIDITSDYPQFSFQNRVIDKVKRLRAGDPNTVYIDRNFLPNKEYIYAVCAIDAHGQISNYSSQIKVNLSIKPYKLEVKTISPPGAPLIFPNYYVKSRMFLDVARSARYKKATLRFRPDYKKIKLETDGKIKNIVNSISDNEINSYYLQIINPDRGKQVLLKYQIDDTINSIVDRDERRRVAEQLGISEEDLVL